MLHTYNDTLFRQQFPEFANTGTYPAGTLGMYFTMATSYINANDSSAVSGDTLTLALNLMTAHIAKSNTMLAAGINTVLISGSSEGSVSVSLTPPPVKTAWQWWLATTGYGAQLRALLKNLSLGIQIVGGSLERASFRKAGGVF